MSRCPSCAHDNPPGTKFCGECGARLALGCPSCGASNPPANKFCGECGTSLESASRPPAAAATPRFASPQSYTPKHLAERILTSLLWEFTHSHRTEGCLLVEAASVSYGRATAYLPVIELLKTYFAIEPRDDARKIREKVTGKLLSLDRALEPALSPLLSLLEVPVEDERWGALDASQRRQRTLESVKRVLLREGQVQPVTVVFEDLHTPPDGHDELAGAGRDGNEHVGVTPAEGDRRWRATWTSRSWTHSPTPGTATTWTR